MLMKATYIPVNVSAGVNKDIVWASMEIVNPYTRDTGIQGNVSCGSPVVKLNLIDRDKGTPNIKLAERLRDAFSRIYLQPIEFEASMELVKKAGVEQMSFVVFDAVIPEPKQLPKSA